MGPKLEALWERNYSVYGRRKLTRAAKKAGLDIGRDQCRWVSWFNEERFHGELDDLTPAEAETAYYRHHSQPDAA